MNSTPNVTQGRTNRFGTYLTAEQCRRVPQEMQEARKFLCSDLGYDDLSTIEGVHLRHYIEQCIVEADHNEARRGARRAELRKEGRSEQNIISIIGNTDFDPASEAVFRWLIDLYNSPYLTMYRRDPPEIDPRLSFGENSRQQLEYHLQWFEKVKRYMNRMRQEHHLL